MTRIIGLILEVAVAVAAGAFLTILVVTVIRDGDRIRQLQHDVACLKHPDHATSSVGPLRLAGGRGVTLPTLVVCP